MTDWQPGDPLYERPGHRWQQRGFFSIKDEDDSTEVPPWLLRSCAARWPEPFLENDCTSALADIDPPEGRR